MKSRAVMVAAAALLFVPGCAVFGPRKSDVPEATLPDWIGRVVMVDSVHCFALVDTGAGAVPSPGSLVMAVREKSRTALLKVTEDARPPYVAMEILQGAPALGDQAALDESKEPPATPSPGS